MNATESLFMSRLRSVLWASWALGVLTGALLCLIVVVLVTE